jgi:hypothetical protein
METQQLQRELAPAVTEAEHFLKTANEPINNPIAYEGAATFLKDVKSKFKELDEKEKAITKPINDGLKLIRDMFRKPKDLLTQAETALKRGMVTYQREQERIAAEAQRKADEDVRKERERLAKLEAKAIERGDETKAEQLAERQAAVVAPIIQTEKPKVSGISTRKDYDFEIVDAAKLPREYLMPDDKKIRKVVKALGAEASIPGIRIIERDILAARAS